MPPLPALPFRPAALLLVPLAGTLACAGPPDSTPDPPDAPYYDVLIRGGTVYDGSGGEPYEADVAIAGDAVAAVGDLGDARAGTVVDARGLAVAPGFVNVLSWGFDDLLHDGRGLSDLRQGVTVEVFGEGSSPGPLTDEMARERRERQGDLEYEITWRTFAGALNELVGRGVSPNVASFVGATSVREHVMGHAARAPTDEELDRMREIVRQAMREGALGVGSSLIYEPAFHATTAELVALAAAAGEHGGMYISHMRSEGNELLEALDELIEIARRADVPAEVYHLKASGERNWPKLDSAVARIERARAEGLRITADVYTYAASSTGLDAAMPQWVQEGGLDAWVERLQDPEVRERVAREMADPEVGTGYASAGSPENILVVDFRTDSLEHLEGKSLAEVAEMRGEDPRHVAMDLVVQDHSRVGSIYFTMSEENLRKKIALPWVSFCSDAGALAPEGVFLESMPHPRAYGSFARAIGKFRREGVLSLAEAVRRLSALPAENFGLERRGRLEPGHYADVVVFDPERVRDHATFEDPHQLATGVVHVFVNGVRVLADGEHTRATPGRFLRGPGWTPGTASDRTGGS